MAWETRRKARSYYYRKQRIHGRVVSEYVGGGETAALIAQLDALYRAEEREQAERDRSSRECAAALEQMADELDSLVSQLTRAVLIARGSYTHKGQWRLKRGKRNVNDSPTSFE